MENKNFKVFVFDEFSPQDNAMLQALYSRSSKSVMEHVEKVRQTGSGKFMETYYVGYGHASIADCGSTTIFIEGASILADKAIQDWYLYSGQETSTRYIDMSKQPVIDSLDTEESREIIERWMDFYTNSQEKMNTYIKSLYPRKENEEEKIYEKAVKARVFDIMRGFLPAGITTQLSWHTNLRQAYDKLSTTIYHPLEEVRNIAQQILSQLKEKYPSSFSQRVISEQEKYRKEMMEKHNYYFDKDCPNFSFSTTINNSELEKYKDIISNRPEKTLLPYFLGGLGQVSLNFLLDFGSFRDVQRHRSAVSRMPLLTTKLGFHNWYLEQLPDDLKKEAQDLIKTQTEAIEKLKTSDEIRQYYIAMGFLVPCRFTFYLPGAVYTSELRSGHLVHPTLRAVALKMIDTLKNNFPLLVLHPDLEPSEWDVKRGTQDITQK
ncbi:MAG: Alternative thymidylate synthase-like protein [Candidatus Wolfebacteria bacterium GW2011_GWC1_43_10]|uniref:Alternative thymidylate synthase-like protein n=1 Tax=Candidatus Wolfebacteria bacterium GW2011_GWC1_43_10 TaxID=1619011 RepID=A0A0G1F5M5_9BACT|nr:MAG: Alternative thymidylate synthase-like protein [Candidatus Wolfebacteria bacterium GW2011_GWC1_43_10]